MQASRAALPPRPVTAPAAAGYPPAAGGSPTVLTPARRGGRPEVARLDPSCAAAAEALPASVAALATPTRRGTPTLRGAAVVPLGAEVTYIGTSEHGCLATPKNSDRQGLNGQARVMMPRSAHSIRHNVMQARGAERSGAAPDLVPQPSSVVSCGTPSRRSLTATPPPLCDEVVHSTVTWEAGPLATPKNGERRDLNGSVQLMAPLWRGSSLTSLGVDAPRRTPSAVTTPSGCSSVQVMPNNSHAQRLHAAAPPEPVVHPVSPPVAAASILRRSPTPLGTEVLQTAATPAAGTPLRRSPTPLSVEVAPNAVVSWMSVATPKNSDRRDLNGSMQLNAPLWRGSAGTPLVAEVHAGAS